MAKETYIWYDRNVDLLRLDGRTWRRSIVRIRRSVLNFPALGSLGIIRSSACPLSLLTDRSIFVGLVCAIASLGAKRCCCRGVVIGRCGTVGRGGLVGGGIVVIRCLSGRIRRLLQRSFIGGRGNGFSLLLSEFAGRGSGNFAWLWRRRVVIDHDDLFRDAVFVELVPVGLAIFPPGRMCHVCGGIGVSDRWQLVCVPRVRRGRPVKVA